MSGAAGASDQATVTVTVAVNPDEAFLPFTRDINLWWRRGPRFRSAPGDKGIICVEPRLGGRVFESYNLDAAAGGGERVVEVGRTKVWDPPNRLLFEWWLANFVPHEQTEVEVLFTPSSSGTRVTVVHRGWSHLRGDHPARHGLQSSEFIRMIGLWWGEQMKALGELVATEQ